MKDTDYDYYYNYNALSSKHNPYHGRIDYLIYNKKSENKLPLIPVIKADRYVNDFTK